MPGGDVGLAVIILTVLVKFIIFPLSQKSIKSQTELKKLEPEIEKIKAKYPDKKEQANQTMALYKEHGVSPFSGCLPTLLQFPIIVALYFVFRSLAAHTDPLYSFVHFPSNFSMHLFGFINLDAKNIFLAVIAGGVQAFQLWMMNKNIVPKPKEIVVTEKKTSFGEELGKNMTKQMQYTIPLLITYIAYQYKAAVALYLITSNMFSIIQERVVRRKMLANVTKI